MFLPLASGAKYAGVPIRDKAQAFPGLNTSHKTGLVGRVDEKLRIIVTGTIGSLQRLMITATGPTETSNDVQMTFRCVIYPGPCN